MEQLDIYKNWMTAKTLSEKTRAALDVHGAGWETDLVSLQVYSKGGNPFRTVVDATKPASPPFNYEVVLALNNFISGQIDARLALYETKSGDPVPVLCRTYGYGYWRTRIEHQRKLGSPSGNGMCFTSSVESLVGCLYCGWMKEAEMLAHEILILYKRHRFYNVRGKFSQPLYHWLLHICFDYWGWEFSGWGWDCYTHISTLRQNFDEQTGRSHFQPPVEDIYAPPECFSETVLNKLFEHWRDPELDTMHDQLVWLCDYYTHRTRAADGTEFGSDLLHTRFPATILAWFRLREQLGLINPIIDHPLMQPDYVQLPSPQPFYSDELLDAILARLRYEEIPNLGDMPKEPLDSPLRRSWIQRLFDKE